VACLSDSSDMFGFSPGDHQCLVPTGGAKQSLGKPWCCTGPYFFCRLCLSMTVLIWEHLSTFSTLTQFQHFLADRLFTGPEFPSKSHQVWWDFCLVWCDKPNGPTQGAPIGASQDRNYLWQWHVPILTIRVLTYIRKILNNTSKSIQVHHLDQIST